ncbi:hypothetical protein Phum_PHUM262900 [Pediculus humanus corporis]|uniref:Uncharacterized protein n=1 Tax=Pediculus humanus subsp. corporis TaxID=121224 RepID=E0VKF9_PEDHC|nr:uncharacterized protein Phum_PHUM262900 [Pediculus humanus corporis]EEB13875.1 hypothetical protein Phum_PHUM262900 [Pediculus humanus corporis]
MRGSLNDSIGKIYQKSYNFEDFFWTGSGDGPVGEFNNITNSQTIFIHPSSLETWKTTTVFHTTTILFATVYPDARGCFEHECVPEISPVQTGSVDFSLPTYVPPNASEIRPSNTVTNVHTTTLSWPHIFVKKNNKTDFEETVSPTPKLSTSKIHFDDGGDGDGHEGNGIGENNFPQTTVFPDIILPDEKYWLLTILKDDKHLPKINLKLTEKKLSNLYEKAFYRGHNKFLTENDLVDEKDSKFLKFVNIHIFNTSQIGNDLGIIYTVSINGNPVPANTAANDMRLLTTREIIAELGRPILTKAEPYVKTIVPFGARVRGKTRDTWLLIGSVIAAILLLLLLVALFVLILSKSQSRKNSAKTSAEIEEERGNSNLGYDDGDDGDDKNDVLNVGTSVREGQKIIQTKKWTELKIKSECLEDKKDELKNDEKQINSSSSSSCSGSSEASLVRIRNQKMKKDAEDKPKPKPRARDRKILSSDCRNVS